MKSHDCDLLQTLVLIALMIILKVFVQSSMKYVFFETFS